MTKDKSLVWANLAISFSHILHPKKVRAKIQHFKLKKIEKLVLNFRYYIYTNRLYIKIWDIRVTLSRFHTRTHTRMHSHSHALTLACTHTRTHTEAPNHTNASTHTRTQSHPPAVTDARSHSHVLNTHTLAFSHACTSAHRAYTKLHTHPHNLTRTYTHGRIHTRICTSGIFSLLYAFRLWNPQRINFIEIGYFHCNGFSAEPSGPPRRTQLWVGGGGRGGNSACMSINCDIWY